MYNYIYNYMYVIIYIRDPLNKHARQRLHLLCKQVVFVLYTSILMAQVLHQKNGRSLPLFGG